MRKHASAWCIVGTALAAGACGPGAVGEAVRPADPTAKEALGEPAAEAQCRSVASYTEPLVVDWKSNERLDLEVAMKDGVAVVAYDCKTIKLLKGCKLTGTYGFAGVSRKEDVVQITNADELAANLPLSAVTLGGEVKSGSSIDLALIMVGKKGTTVEKAARPELTGSCDGATHFVRGAFVGAFAMATGTNGKVRAVAEMFGASASGSSSTEKKTANKDGDLEACRKATPDAPKPPEQCQAAIRVELVPLLAARPEEGAGAPKQDTALKNPCPEGMVLTGGKCSAAQDAPHLCKPQDTKECTEQCEKGDPGSCHHLAYRYLEGKDVPKDPAKATALFQKACDGGIAQACYSRADRYMVDRMNAKDENAKTEARLKAQELYNKACELGDGWVCWNISDWYLREGAIAVFPKDPARAVSYVRRGCDLGYGPSCSTLAGMLISGKNTAKDVTAALGLLGRACDGGRWEDCETIGNLYRKGEGVAKDGAQAITAYGRACSMGGLRACNSAGAVLAKAEGVPKDLAKAKEFFEKGCPEKGSYGYDACMSLGELYEKGEGVSKDKARAAELFEKTCMMGGCVRAAEIWLKGDGVKKDEDKAIAAYEKGCIKSSDKKACKALGPILEKKDKERAKAFYADLCTRMLDKEACAAEKRLGAK